MRKYYKICAFVHKLSFEKIIREKKSEKGRNKNYLKLCYGAVFMYSDYFVLMHTKYCCFPFWFGQKQQLYTDWTIHKNYSLVLINPLALLGNRHNEFRSILSDRDFLRYWRHSRLRDDKTLTSFSNFYNRIINSFMTFITN